MQNIDFVDHLNMSINKLEYLITSQHAYLRENKEHCTITDAEISGFNTIGEEILKEFKIIQKNVPVAF